MAERGFKPVQPYVLFIHRKFAAGSDFSAERMAEAEGCVIHCWSAPRCLSTSLMYAWGNRPDCDVLDEPLYGHYLRVTGAPRPYREEVLAAMNQDGDEVVMKTLLKPPPGGKRYLYAKHIAKQRIGVTRCNQLFQSGKHFMLVRNPHEILMSFNSVLPATLHETCFPALVEVFSELRALNGGVAPPIVDSYDIRKDPEGVLRALCERLDVPFTAHMLQWEAGSRPYDGLWAPWWYATTHKCTGFGPPTTPPPLPAGLKNMYEECMPLYSLIARHKITAKPALVPRPITASAAASAGTHTYEADPRNADVLVGMRDGMTGEYTLVRRPDAKVSVLDSNFMLGDGVWEGIRLHKGVLSSGSEHIARLFEGAKALDMDLNVSPKELVDMIYQCCDANGMDSDVHIRLMVSRGLKPTPYQDPSTTLGMPLIVILPEHKRASEAPKVNGITLFTVHVRRGPPDVQDPMWNSHSKLNCIAACIQAKKAGADEGLMLDPHGFVATCNSVNFFIVRGGQLWAPTTKHQIHGITRQRTLDIAARAGITTRELDFTLTQVYSADECFVTGTFAGQLPVTEVDGRCIGDGTRGPVTKMLQKLYALHVDEESDCGRRLESFATARPILRRQAA